MQDKEITTLTINVGITTNAQYTLQTTKSEEEVIEDIKRKGIDILYDENYNQIDFLIDEESSLHDSSESVIYNVGKKEFEFNYNYMDSSGKN